jgi:hypothetical protein
MTKGARIGLAYILTYEQGGLSSGGTRQGGYQERRKHCNNKAMRHIERLAADLDFHHEELAKSLSLWAKALDISRSPRGPRSSTVATPEWLVWPLEGSFTTIPEGGFDTLPLSSGRDHWVAKLLARWAGLWDREKFPSALFPLAPFRTSSTLFRLRVFFVAVLLLGTNRRDPTLWRLTSDVHRDVSGEDARVAVHALVRNKFTEDNVLWHSGWGTRPRTRVVCYF